jgi:hypothetical protein
MNHVVEKNFGEFSPLDALKQVVNSKGNHLIMAYGYITSSQTIVSIFAEVFEFLKSCADNKVSIFVGVMFVSGEKGSLDEKISELDRVFESLLPEKLYEDGLSDRISVFGIKNFHPKFSIMLNESDEEETTPVSALTGSSNLSYSALSSANRFELDILMIADQKFNTLLNSFSKTVLKMLEASIDNEDIRLGKKVGDRIYWNFVNKEIMDEIWNEKIQREHHELKFYTNSAHSEEDGQELYESDVALGIRSEYERDEL